MAEGTTHSQTWDMNPGHLDYQSKALYTSPKTLSTTIMSLYRETTKEAENYPLAASSTAMRPGKTGDQGKPLTPEQQGGERFRGSRHWVLNVE